MLSAVDLCCCRIQTVNSAECCRLVLQTCAAAGYRQLTVMSAVDLCCCRIKNTVLSAEAVCCGMDNKETLEFC